MSKKLIKNRLFYIILFLIFSSFFFIDNSNQTSNDNEHQINQGQEHRILNSTISPQESYDNIMVYLDSRIQEKKTEREIFWQNKDFSSLLNYQESIIPYRKKLSELLSIPTECLNGQNPSLLENKLIKSDSKINIYHWRFKICDNNLILDSLVAFPVGVSKQYPLLVAIHGQCGNPERVMGLQGDDYHHSFGLKLAEAGYIVFSPLLITKPTQEASECKSPANTQRNQLDNRGNSLGERIIGIELGKIINALDYFSSLETVDSTRIGSYGISMGGAIALYLGAIDERIEVNVISQYIENREEKLIGLNYNDALWKREDADYNYFDDYLAYFTDLELSSLILPRKIFIEVGSNDNRSEGAQETYTKIRSLYQKLKLPDDFLEIGIEEGGHEIFLEGSLNFINKWLKIKD